MTLHEFCPFERVRHHIKSAGAEEQCKKLLRPAQNRLRLVCGRLLRTEPGVGPNLKFFKALDCVRILLA